MAGHASWVSGIIEVTMTDIFDPATRSRIMSRIKGSNTSPEIAVRKVVHSLGLRFRLHCKTLPGKPDIVLARHRTVIFIHGCFWHRHKGCPLASTPKTRVDYWQAKFEGNVRRDKANIRKLRRIGWRPIVIWECQVKDREKLERSLRGKFGLQDE